MWSVFIYWEVAHDRDASNQLVMNERLEVFFDVFMSVSSCFAHLSFLHSSLRVAFKAEKL